MKGKANLADFTRFFMLKRRFKYCLRFFLSIFLLMAIGENCLCINSGKYPGIKLSSIKRQDFANKSSIEKVCCGIEQPCSGKSWEASEVLETADDLGRRPTPFVINPRNNVLALGCSYTYGIGVKDHDTYLWRIGENFPGTRIDNYADPGYGTVQCRARLEQLLKNSAAAGYANSLSSENELFVHYDKIFYGLIGDHLKRNGNVRWNEDAESNYVFFPWAEYSGDGVLYHGAENVWWPGENLFRTVVFFRNLYLKSIVLKHDADIDWLNLNKNAYEPRVRRQIDDRLKLFNGVLSEMLELAQNYGAEFYVLHLDGNLDNLIDPVLKERGLKTLDISFPFIGKEEYYALPHCGGHPNALVHKAWAESFIKQMDGRL